MLGFDAISSDAISEIPVAAAGGVQTGAGSSSLTFTVSAVGASQSATTGSSTLTFTPSGVGAAVIASVGSSSLTFTPSGVGASTVNSVGTSTVTFSVSGASGASGNAAGSSSLTFTVSGVGESTASVVGSSSITFSVSGAGSSLTGSNGAGSSSLTFTVSAVSSSVATATGSSSLTFDVQGRSPQTAEVRDIGAGGVGKKRRFILPDNTEVYATTQEVYAILDQWVKPKKKKKQVVKLLDKIELQEETIEEKKVERVVIKPIAIWEPDQEKYEAALMVLKRRRQLTEILLLAA